MSRKRISVVGGLYRERCLRPFWNEVYGSAGRSASALARLGADVQLLGYADDLGVQVLQSRAALEGFNLAVSQVPCVPSFDYDHGLSTPRISVCVPSYDDIRVADELVVRFGMLEGDALVKADRAVYDPQNTHHPTDFGANGSEARELAIVLNRNEARVLSGSSSSSVVGLAQTLIDSGKATVVVVKDGPRGALVHDGSSASFVPAYPTRQVWKIGSGDMFASHFAFNWLHERKSAVECAHLASKATALFAQTRGFPSRASLSSFAETAVAAPVPTEPVSQPLIYLAGPFFTHAQVWLVEQFRAALRGMGLAVFSPYHDVGLGSADDVVSVDLEALERCDAVLAICDGMDPGTIFEVGYARAHNKPVIAYCENEASERRKMMEGSRCVIVDELVSAVYGTAWVVLKK